MAVIPFEIQSKKRTVKNETSNRLWKTNGGFKMSRKAMTLLGINKENNKLVFGTSDSGNLVIKVVKNEPYHCSVSIATNRINNPEVIAKLESVGDSFEISSNEIEGGYHEMILRTDFEKVTEKVIKDKKSETPKTPKATNSSIVALQTTGEEDENFG